MKVKRVKKKASPFFHTHVHSRSSILDAISSVDVLVEKAVRLKQPAMGLTNHGNLGETVPLYRAGQKHGIPVYPGMEGYLVVNEIDGSKEAGAQPRYHIGFLSLNLDGYRELVKLSSLAHTRPRFNRFPRISLSDLAAFKTENIAVLTGCFFGLVQQTLITKGYKDAKRIVEMYARWYPNTFVEIQNHNIEHKEQAAKGDPWKNSEYTHDSDICEALASIADEVGLPLLATQDSHYCSSKQKLAHELMKRMVYKGGDGVNEFPGDSFHFASTEWVEEHHDPDHWKRALEGSERLLELHDLVMPALEKYKPQVPSQKKNPSKWLRRMAYKGLDNLEEKGLLVKKRKFYEKRIEHELDTIEFLGHAGYFTVVHLVVEFCKDNGICVEARGSSNGSLICYLLGITSVDPLEWKLLFERFLSKDRKKPPDIDLDVEDRRRPEVLEFLSNNFEISQIGTFAALGARESDDKGNILVSYNSYLRDKLGNEKFIPKYGRGIESIAQVKMVSTADYRGLRQLSKEKVLRSYGVHPAGILLGTKEQKIGDYVPTMIVASSDTIVTQFSGEEVEEFGYLKLDLLGQRSLSVLRRCQELIGREDPNDFSWIPNDDKPTCRYLSKGETENGIFQFEGFSMAYGARGLKIRSTMDCILAGALFRPACIESGVTQAYIDRRFDKSLRDVKHPHPAFEEVLKETHGLVLFQEQVLEIMRRLGLDYEGINTFFKIVKDSGKGATARNLERIKEVEKQWADICESNDIDDPEGAWHYIEGYTQYGFNKAHATGYGLRSYRAAYLKTHYPLEYVAALLEMWAGKTEKEKVYIRLARKMDIRLLSADVNISKASWTIDRKKNAIRRGLSSIKGIGKTAAAEIADNAPYESLEDMIEKCSARTCSGAPKWKKEGVWTGNLLALKTAGALASLGYARDGWD